MEGVRHRESKTIHFQVGKQVRPSSSGFDAIETTHILFLLEASLVYPKIDARSYGSQVVLMMV